MTDTDVNIINRYQYHKEKLQVLTQIRDWHRTYSARYDAIRYKTYMAQLEAVAAVRGIKLDGVE